MGGLRRCKPWLKEAHPALVPELFEEGELEAKYVALAHPPCLPLELHGLWLAPMWLLGVPRHRFGGEPLNAPRWVA